MIRLLSYRAIRASSSLGVFAAVLILVGARVSTAQEGASLPYEVPEGWTRQDGPRGFATLTPNGVSAPGTVLVTVFPSEPFSGSPHDLQSDAVERLKRSGAWVLAPPRLGTAGGFLVATVHILSPPTNLPGWMGIYTARWADRAQTILVYANSDELIRTYQPVVEAMVRRIQVPGAVADAPTAANAPTGPSSSRAGVIDNSPQPQPPCFRPQGIEICPKAVLTGNRSVPIVGAYLSTGARTSYGVDDGVRSRVGTTILLLFANGVAVRTNAMKSGANDDSYWAEGFATMDARDPSSVGARRVGRWTERDGAVSIAWQIGPASALTRDGANLNEQYARWTPYVPVDGLRLDGQYVRVVPFGPPWSITLRRNGTFAADGLNNTMGGTFINPGFPEHGGGTYEISKWSLILRFANGFVQSINLMLGQGSPDNPGVLILNGHDYTRGR
jgi:hypothetical protein